MKAFIISVMLILVTIIQCTLIQYIEILGVKPNLIITFIICISLVSENIETGAIGFFAGMLLDIFTGKLLGLHSLLSMYTGISVSSVKKGFFKESYLVALLFTFIFSFSYEFIFYILNYFIWGETRIIYALISIILPEAIYNAIFSIPIYSLIIKINRWSDKNKDISRKYKY